MNVGIPKLAHLIVYNTLLDQWAESRHLHSQQTQQLYQLQVSKISTHAA